jgi:hypothetical protein
MTDASWRSTHGAVMPLIHWPILRHTLHIPMSRVPKPSGVSFCINKQHDACRVFTYPKNGPWNGATLAPVRLFVRRYDRMRMDTNCRPGITAGLHGITSNHYPTAIVVCNVISGQYCNTSYGPHRRTTETVWMCVQLQRRIWLLHDQCVGSRDCRFKVLYPRNDISCGAIKIFYK